MSFTGGQYAAQGRRLLNDVSEIVPHNTKIAYANFQEEFKGFCDAKHPADQFPHCVTEEKLFGFLWYQAYREKRPKNKKHDTFDLADYENVVAAHPPNRTSQFTDEELATSNYPGYQTWEKCRSAILSLAKDQRDENSNSLRQQDFQTARMDRLKAFVKGRVPHVKISRCDEKMDESSIPYQMLSYVKPLEMEFWKYQSSRLNQAMVSLRNRLFYLLTLAALVRGESLWRCCLSDLSGFYYHARREPHPYQILVAKIAIGKNNETGQTLYGRVLRHKDVTMCAIGALAFYLLNRFECTCEDQEFDFRENKNWFHVKLMASADNNTRAVSNKQYATAIRKHLAVLGVSSCHAIHFGRSEGPKILEFEEVEPDSIKCLGNWSPDTQEKAYSAHMPLPAMRVAGGHEPERGCHFIPRSSVEPPERLCRMIFPFVENAEEALRGAIDSNKRVTAAAFLSLMRSLRIVVLQDTAAMMLLGRTHAIFDHHPAFHDPSFAVFKEQMAAALTAAPAVDPLNVTVERVMPGVMRQFDRIASERNNDRVVANQQHASLCQEIRGVERLVTAGFSQANAKIDRLQANVVTIPYFHGFLVHMSSYGHPTTNSPFPPPALPPRQELMPDDNFTMDWDNTNVSNQPQRQAGDAGGGAVAGTITTTPAPGSVPKPRLIYRTATEMFQDWYGVGSSTKFPPGGIHRLDEHNTAWRKTYTVAERKSLSRLKFVVSIIDKKVERHKEVEHLDVVQARERALAFFDNLMQTQKNCKTLSGLERHLKKWKENEATAQLIEQTHEEGQADG
jgi:hypothetical protein